MHPSPSKPPTHKPTSSQEEASTLKTIIFFITATLLLMTSISCFATSWVVTALVDWPVGSVVEKRSNENNKNNKLVSFSFLHAALQRSDHCGAETQAQLDKALGTYAKSEISKVIDQAESKRGKIEMAVQEERNMLQKEEADSKKVIDDANKKRSEENVESVKRQRELKNDHHHHDSTEKGETSSRKTARWNIPQFALRASKIETHLLDGFYDPEKRKQAAKELLHKSKEEQEAALQVTSVTAVASQFRNVLSFMRVVGQPIQQGNEIVFARNTADKLLYQLRNFEPLTKILVAPPWNPVVGMDTFATHKQSICDDETKTKRLILGLSSVSRTTNYLFQTVSSLIASMSAAELKQVTIVILDGDVPAGKNPDLSGIKTAFEPYVNDGTIILISREESNLQHPEMRKGVSTLTHRWGDDENRIFWRSKQVLDVAYLMNFVQENNQILISKSKLAEFVKRKFKKDAMQQQQQNGGSGESENQDDNNNNSEKNCGGYFLMLEDDIISTQHFVTKILWWVKSSLFNKKDTKWTVASFYNPWEVKDKDKLPPFKFFGVIGQLFRIHELPTMVEFLRKNFDQSPLDWLFVDYLKKMNGQMVVHTPSMFQHKGVISSLEGKTQDGAAVDFVPK